MPLLRSVSLLVAANGVVLHAQSSRKPTREVHIAFGSAEVVERPAELHNVDDDQRLHAHGIIGIFKLPPYSFLISIRERRKVAQLWNKPAYEISDIDVIPLHSYAAAKDAVKFALRSPSSFTEEDQDVEDASDLSEDWLSQALRPRNSPEPSIAEEVIAHRGKYGLLADGFFSRLGWTNGQRRNLGLPGLLSSPAAGLAPQPGDGAVDTKRLSLDSSLSPAAEQRIKVLLPKIVRTLKSLFSSKTFFFSYDLDLTRRLQLSVASEKSNNLSERADDEYYFNRHLLEHFEDAGLHEYLLPIMQGFVGQRDLHFPGPEMQENSLDAHSSTPEAAKASDQPHDLQVFQLTLISRRSIRRPGLRYLRRGINDDGNVANSVETEQILTSSDDAKVPASSFVQARGSIPLFYTQSPYALKPVPVLTGSPKANTQAFAKHIGNLGEKYGNLKAISLVNAHGAEQPIGQAYEKAVSTFNSTNPQHHLQFTWFDFHSECKGMKFDNVVKLVDDTKPFIDHNGWTTLSNPSPSRQKGVIRSNCMDCLDRTNVVQSTFAEYVLDAQLSQLLGRPIKVRSESGNSLLVAGLWADNGDAISKAYASSNALKGDFTRTRQRSYLGLWTDFSLTMTRYYHNLFEDFFVQAVIDYSLGKVNETVFSEFEAGVQGVDLAIDVSRHRRLAIENAKSEYASDTVLGGWVLAAAASESDTAKPNATTSDVMQEIVFLLTETSVIRARYDFEGERVVDLLQIPLTQISSLQRGVWIESLAHTDEYRNFGFVVKYATDNAQPEKVSELRLKALPSASTGKHASEMELVGHITDEIVHAAEGFQGVKISVQDAPLASLDQARRKAGYLNQLGLSLREMILG